jgi:hypothetical protein
MSADPAANVARHRMHWKNPATASAPISRRRFGGAERVGKLSPDIMTTSTLRPVYHTGIAMNIKSAT